VDWSRFAFGVVVQVIAVAVPLTLLYVYSNPSDSVCLTFLLISVGLAGCSFPMVRQSLLFSDTALDKFFPSKGYACPGVWIVHGNLFGA
jgi:hypothetical protein